MFSASTIGPTSVLSVLPGHGGTIGFCSYCIGQNCLKCVVQISISAEFGAALHCDTERFAYYEVDRRTYCPFERSSAQLRCV